MTVEARLVSPQRVCWQRVWLSQQPTFASLAAPLACLRRSLRPFVRSLVCAGKTTTAAAPAACTVHTARAFSSNPLHDVTTNQNCQNVLYNRNSDVLTVSNELGIAQPLSLCLHRLATAWATLGNNRSIDYEFVEVTPLMKLHCQSLRCQDGFSAVTESRLRRQCRSLAKTFDDVRKEEVDRLGSRLRSVHTNTTRPTVQTDKHARAQTEASIELENESIRRLSGPSRTFKFARR